ncbi:hypothetical protein MOO45_04870 [Bombilactobacillus folatiphilus]|uniref:Uncharacterized protein n=1 Tax=Bombilactobacillus folatiphilus TaxID=2923362 RepID=A0ABY4P783_9LACO|nr:hypothetical protein [Bombilactobacillus folatiphilus]UQS81560.1 hypothetical protein MOO45_04870 [Bombilactobacillus folatiphilus]
MRAHLVDEISLVLAPHINGNTNEKAVFDTLETFIDDIFAFDNAQMAAFQQSS